MIQRSSDSQGTASASDLYSVRIFFFDARTPLGQMELGGCLVKLLQRRYRETITLSALL